MVENTEMKDWEKTLSDMHAALKASHKFILTQDQNSVYNTDRGAFRVSAFEKKVSDTLKRLDRLTTAS